MSPPVAPKGTGPAGRRLWKAALAEYDLDEHELALLREAVRTVDLLDKLAAIVDREGLVVPSPQGPRSHPSLIELRQQRITLARLISALRMPAGDEEEPDARRPQRRVGVRGVYRP